MNLQPLAPARVPHPPNLGLGLGPQTVRAAHQRIAQEDIPARSRMERRVVTRSHLTLRAVPAGHSEVGVRKAGWTVARTMNPDGRWMMAADDEGGD
jgi:hypothetical protein